MDARPAHERYASVPWLIVTMTVVALALGLLAAQYFESHLLWKLAAAWVIVWLPLFVFSLWSSRRLREERAAAAFTEANYRQLVEQARDIIYQTDINGRFTYVNPTATRIQGYTPDELIGRHFTEFIRPDAREAVKRQIMRQFLRRAPSIYQEFPAVKKDGGEIWIGQNVQAMIENDRVVGFQAVARDITDRKRAEEEILRTHAFLNSIVENIPDMIFVKDAGDLKFVRFNKAGENLLGYRRQDLIGRNDYDFFPKEDADFFAAKDRAVLESGQLLDIPEEPLATKHRGTRILHTKKIPIVDNEGRPRYLLGISEDITERKAAETEQKRLLAELAESKNRFEMFFRQTPSAISITTINEGRFVDVNRQAEILTGYSRDELIGRTTLEMKLYVDPADRDRIMHQLATENRGLTNLERQIRTKSGEVRTAIFSLVPIQMGTEPCLLSIAHDITERKQAENELRRRSRQQAIEAELSLLAVTVQQDLSNLLNTAARLTLNALDADYCKVLELHPNGAELRLRASAGWKDDCVGRVQAVEPGSLIHAALRSNKPVIQTLAGDARFGGPPWLHMQGTVNGMGVNIPGPDGPWGVLGVYAAGTHTFSTDDIHFLQTVSSILAAAIERVRADSVLKDANQALRLLSRQLLKVQEDDHRAIARDLHDEIGQSLTAIKLNVERAQRAQDHAARTRIMQDCAQITERVLTQVRNLSLDLHPSILDDLGLVHTLKWYADRQAERAGLRIDVTADPSLPRLPQDVEVTCFRIAQEALTNVVRHARARRIGITLTRRASAVELCVQDDGAGFVVDKALSPSGGKTSVGLTGMQERARLLGGTVKITSAPRCGTTVIATLPLLVGSPADMPAEEVPRS